MSKIDWDDLESEDWPFTGPDLFEKLSHSDDELQPWQLNVYTQLCKSMLPGLDLTELDDDQDATAAGAGGATAALHEYFGRIAKLLEKPQELRTGEEETLLKSLGLFAAGENTPNYEGLKENLDQISEIVGEGSEIIIKEKPDEAGEFFQGFGKMSAAYKNEPDPLRLPSETDATGIYLMLFMFGTIAQDRLINLREFYDFLSETQKSVYLGSFDRFRKVCNRVEFSIGQVGQSSKRDIEAIKLTVLEGLREVQSRLNEDHFR